MKKPTIDRNNPAFNFITHPIEGPRENERQAAPMTREPKSRRLQLLIRPSLYERLRAGSERNGTSVNEYINSILEDATKEI